MFLQCSISISEPEDQSMSSILDDSSIPHEPHNKVSSEHAIEKSPCCSTKKRNIKSKSNVKGKNPRIKVCYRCRDAAQKVRKGSLEKNSTRVDSIITCNDKWITKANSLNCLPDDCYNIFS